MTSVLNHRLVNLFIIVLWSLLYVTTVEAAYQRSYLNFDFESNALSNACYVQLDGANVIGWNTTHKSQQGSGNCSTPSPQFGKLIELWSHGFNGMPARQGNVFAELNAEEYSEMQQNICLIKGEPVTWKLSHNGRNSTDRMSLRAGGQQIVSVATTPSGQGTITSCTAGNCNVSSQVVTYNNSKYWADYSGQFNYSGATGQTILGFKSDTGSSSSVGNFLDAIQISVKPIIEFAAADYSIPENASPQDIKVIVVGIIPVGGLTLTFNVNDGVPPNNAEINLDYKINGSTNKTFTKTIPAGDYGMGTPYTLSIPVEIINDSIYEPEEKFTVTIQKDDSNFYLYSSSVCGSSGNGTTTYTIVDDDSPEKMNLAINKSQRAGSTGSFSNSPLTVTTNSIVQYQLVVSNLGENPVSPSALATFIDSIPTQLSNLSIVGTPVSNNATTCNASLSGNTLNGNFSGVKGATCTLVVQGTTANTGGIITNTATVKVPVGNTDIDNSDNSSSVQTTIAAATLILKKVTTSGVGSFGYALTNTVQNTGSVEIKNTGEIIQVDSDSSLAGAQAFVVNSVGASNNVTITETMPSGQLWQLSSATCTTATNSSITTSISNNTVTIPMSAVSAGGVVSCTLMNTRLSTIKVQKISYGGTGSFTFSGINLNGSTASVALPSITTSTQGVATPSNPNVNSITDRTKDVTLTEGVPPNNYVLTEASCTDANSSITGNVGSFGSLNNSTRVLTVPSTFLITGGADITCTFVNRLNPSTDLLISKTNNETNLLRGQTTSYVVRVTNNGSIPIMGATLTDPVGTNQTQNNVACSNVAGNQCTASLTPTTTQLQSGYNLPKLDAGQFYEVLVTATISSSSISSTDNTATIRPPTGVTNTGTSCSNITTGANTRSFTSATGICSVKDTDTVIAANRTLSLKKVWKNARQFDKATLTADTSTGVLTLESVAAGGSTDQTDTSGTLFIANNTEVILKEVINVGDGNYAVQTPSCTEGTLSNNNDGTYKLLIPSSGNSAISCTYTNARKTATLQIVKTWTNAKTGDVVAIPASLGLSNNTLKFKSTAPTSANSGTAVTVYVGDTVTLGAEIGVNDYAAGDPNYDASISINKDNYNATLSCTANNAATSNSLSGTNAKQSNTLTIGDADTNKAIVCTYNNSRIAQQIKLVKEWKNAAINDQIKVTTTGGTNNPAVTSVSSGSNIESGGIVVVYSGDVITLPSENFITGSSSQYTVTTACNGGSPLNNGLVGRTVTISNNTVVTVCTYTNTKNTAQVTISGTVFVDNSGTTLDASKAYNAIQDAGEVGIANSTIRLNNCSTTQLASTVTSANGDYAFSIEQSQLPSSFCIVQQNLPEYISVSGSNGYTRSTDTITLTKTSATSYSANNFGDVIVNVVLNEDGQHTAIAGDVTDYPHRLTTQIPVQLTQLLQTQTQQPNSGADQPWQALIYRDLNCNAQVDMGEVLFNPTVSNSILLQPSADICLVQRVHVPSNVVAGAQHIGTLQAGYQFSLTNPAQTISGQTGKRQDVTLIGSAGLTLTKKVRAVSSCPSTSADQNVFVTNNQANKQDNLEYEITYKNNSVKKLQNVKIKDSLPTGTNFGSVNCVITPSGNTCNSSRSGDYLEWNLTGLLNPSASGTLRFCVSQ
ncbi:hypothetical protein MMP66_06125 [Acinetobacter dispersus]|uniref:beta strand repeat-containing protein n=1 Tax=Acinetobacter dispersus TaxID=70348 RepID=UPI001F4AAC1D|nr:hypothetical protein [Acinetobacter dispersus]MCH7393857.1 hypothetical protein [Acinetobacter dispersus]